MTMPEGTRTVGPGPLAQIWLFVLFVALVTIAGVLGQIRDTLRAGCR